MPRALTTDARSDNQPDWGSRLAWSPDCRSIAYVQGGPDKLIYYGLHKLAVVPAAGGAPRVLTADLDLNVALAAVHGRRLRDPVHARGRPGDRSRAHTGRRADASSGS